MDPADQVARLVAIMDRLRSPGGCPWDGGQTHSSLARYLLEETYEVLEALDTGDRVLLREELGDLLLQVVFHARIAAEDPTAPFGLDDIAGDVADKLVRRHPHVFAPPPSDGSPVAPGIPGALGDPGAVDGLYAAWEQRKRAEKQRRGVLDGIPQDIPALLLATKVLDRLDAAGMAVPAPTSGGEADGGDHARAAVGAELLAVVERARAAGVEPEQALRIAVRQVSVTVAATEQAARGDTPPAG